MERTEVTKMTKKLLVFFLAFAVVVAFSLPALAQDIVQGKIKALDKTAKTITIGKTQYSLSDEAAQVMVKVGDMVEATVEGKVVKKLALSLM
jgi:hypothetical protein